MGTLDTPMSRIEVSAGLGSSEAGTYIMVCAIVGTRCLSLMLCWRTILHINKICGLIYAGYAIRVCIGSLGRYRDVRQVFLLFAISSADHDMFLYRSIISLQEVDVDIWSYLHDYVHAG